MTIRFQTLDELPDVARRLLADGRSQPVWMLEGDMGAGKTTLVKAIGRVLGVISTMQSPTFSLINEYSTHEGQPVYHFDCYRLRNEAEALDLGIEEYFSSGYYCFVEWPEKIVSLWPPQFYRVHLLVNDDGSRTVSAQLV